MFGIELIFFVFHDHTHSYNFVKKNPQVDTFHKFQHWFVVDQPYFLLWNLLKIFLENFRKTVYGFEEVCFAEVVILYSQWNLLKIFLENFRKTVYGFEEVCFAEVLYGKMTKFFTSDFSMNFFYSISWRNGAITIHFKGFWRTSANFRNFCKLP